ncbi:MAG TPA: response regulator [Candidatus Limnocylindrales bacterium]|nr:response regulator [Candidatus Limnocylindrales bacterium]
MATSDQVRLLLIEDVPQVAQYVRGLLMTQSAIKILDVFTDGSRAVSQIPELRPDVVVVDALLQGRIKGLQLVKLIHEAGLDVPVIVLTVPQQPVEIDPANGIHGVLSMPFSGYDLITRVGQVHKEHQHTGDHGVSQTIAVFAPKGGVGRTTIAFNLAVAAAKLGTKTVLVDGSIQFADLRALLRVPADAPSILDLPTDRVVESDLGEVLWRDPSGIDILLAPPRIEMAEMVTLRDLEKVLSLLRRLYDAVIIDMSVALDEINLALLDRADVILELVTYDSTTIHNTIALADTFRVIGYSPAKVQYVVNRADANAGIDPADLTRALGRVPEHQIRSEGAIVVPANNQGVPFVLSNPGAGVSQDVERLAAQLLGAGRAPVAAGVR